MDLKTLLKYDFWANEQWLAVFEREEPSASVRSIYEHMLAAQAIWADRCGLSPEMASRDLRACTMALSARWIQGVADTEPSTVVHYQNSKGIAFERSFEEIVRHVVNHGSYHRGQLRGHYEQLEQVVDTDLVIFLDALRSGEIA